MERGSGSRSGEPNMFNFFSKYVQICIKIVNKKKLLDEMVLLKCELHPISYKNKLWI